MKPTSTILFWLSEHNLTVLLVVGMLSILGAVTVENRLDAWVRKPVSLTDEAFLGFLFDIGLVVGYLANRVFYLRVANWVWVLGLFWMTLGVRDALRFYDPRWHQGCSVTQTVVNAFFIVSDKCGSAEDLSFVIFTLPATVLVGCSVGSWIASHRARHT
jgi:hypothetical protein